MYKKAGQPVLCQKSTDIFTEMDGCERKCLKVSIFAWILFFYVTRNEGARVTSLTPSKGSLGGETRLTIHGSGFSADQFSQNDDPNTGNQVYLISASDVQYRCSVHKDGCTEEIITCYTPERMNEEDYYIRVVVDGQEIADSSMCGGNPRGSKCTYKPSSKYTPTIDLLSPRSGKPGTFVTMEGKLVSDRYGSNLPAATNEKEELFLRLYVGPQDCGLKDGDDFYLLQLDGDDTDQGSLKCLTKGTSVGFFNASFIIETPYGRSKPTSNVYHVSYTDTIYMYQAYTDITSVSPATGSTAGGLTLTIHGNYFDNRAPYSAAEAFVGGTKCDITKVVTDQYIECKVAAQPTAKSSYQGNRGVTFEYWTSTSKSSSNVADVLALTSSSPGYNMEILDETAYTDVNDTMDTFVSRMTTLFSPPHDGEYSFFLKANDGAKLYVDGVEKLSAGTDWTGSSRMTLSKSSMYKLQVVHFESSGDASINLKAKFYDTSFTSAWTGKAEQEKQKITISSTVVDEVQVLTFSGYGNQSYTKEVQTVEIDAPGAFRLGLFGVYTAQISGVDEPEDSIATAINDLPIWGKEEAVSVVREATTPPSFTITFESRRGDFPPFEVIPIGDAATFPFSVTETTSGTPDLNCAALSLANVVSQPFTMATLTTSKLQKVIEGMFEAQCPAVFESASIGKVYQSFETSASSFSGTRVKDTEPFCGRYVLKNPSRLYKKPSDDLGITLSTFSTVCFAYKGLLNNVLFIRVSLKQASDGETVQKDIWHQFTFEVDSAEKSETWYYTCVDIASIVTTRYPSDSEFRMNEFSVFRKNADSDCYVDSFFIGRSNTTNDQGYNQMRLRPSMPNGFLIDSVSVASSTSDQYTVTMSPYDCGNELPLFELGSGVVSSGRVTSPSTSATVALSNGNSFTMSVSRTSPSSPPVVGAIDITYNGVTKQNLNVSLEGSEFKSVLESLAGIGKLDVTKTGNCANFDLKVTFLTLAGDLPQMTVNYGNLEGINAAGSITTETNGGLYYNPLMGDMLSTEHSTAQVRVFINGIPTSCTGDCSFSWDSSATPTVSSVTPTSGTSALSTSITITGTGFSSSNSDNTVVIGGANCTVTAATSTSITCDVGNGPVGANKIDVNVAGKGDATHPSGDVTFSYTADISSISPTTGSLGGGSLLTITGYGFKSDANVTINSATCRTVSVTPAQIVCSVPSSNANGTHDVVVEQGASTLSFSSYVYDSTLTATISNINPSTISVTGDTITITGSTFGVSGSVYLEMTQTTVQSWSDSQIVVATDTVNAGQLALKVETNTGYALSSGSIPTVTVDLSVSNIYPLQGSVLGGTRLTITGSGFGTNTTEVDVSVGSVPCDISAITNTQIVCQIGNAARLHTVTNMGVDPAYGIYYAFDKPNLEVNLGETVQWEWSTSDFVKDIAHAIIEVESPSSRTAMEGGINSGTPSRQGTFQYQFTELGTYYFWSGYVDTYGIKNYYGTVTVVEATSSLEQISVSRSGEEAVYNVGGASDPVDSSACQSIVTNKDGCNDTLPSGGDSTKFNFAFYTCSTPIITSISATNGTAVTAITMTGEGLSDTDCQNEVSIGEFTCSASSSSDTSVTCSLVRSGEPDIGVMYPYSLRVGNRGNALIRIQNLQDRSFALVPVIENVTPTSGSLAGGNTITISGFGFGDSPLVDIGGFACTIVSSTYSEIVCDTPSSSSQTAADITVNVYVNGNPLSAECETSSKTCRYSYATLWTPAVSAITPTSMTGATTFTITGSGLGTQNSDVEVTIGGATATVSSVNGTTLEGSIQNIPAGSNDVIVKAVGKGKASGSVTVTGEATISSLSPATGSIHGQTTVTISGTGFVVNQTTVSLGGSACDILSVSLSTVICVTSAHAAGSVSTAITSNGVTYPVQSFSYDTTATPTVSSVSPVSGLPGSSLTITGSNFGSGSPVVTLNDVPCAVSASSATSITCTLGNHATGSVPVSVYVEGLGASNTDVTFEYQLSIVSINPTTGGTAGGQTLTVVGTGFDTSGIVTMCGQACDPTNVTSTQFVCKTPSNTAQTCDVAITLNGLTKTLSSAYTYDASVTPTVSAVTPSRGGTGGGTTITITGSGFGSSNSDVSVTLDDVACAVSSTTNTQIVCDTGAHAGSIDTTVAVEVAGNGIAEESTSGVSAFSYIDVWSSTYTWGGGPVPQEGEFIIIPKGMTLLLDCNTARLDFLLIQGGKLIFDEKDVELQSNIIMITDGGLLQVGTEAQPFQHKAIITLHGHHRSKELPIYGTKVLAVRNGTLELHGADIPITWTKLATTATAAATELQLQHPVEWNVGDEIVIASTGHHHTQSQNEKRTISAVSSDKMTLTLSAALEFEHVGVEETFDGTLVEFRAEVGLLTHNVVFRGNPDPQWEDDIKACEAGFDTGEFATQTCFQGRFGDEIGSSQFGAMILVHAPVMHTHEAEARISNVEVTFAGQAFRLGRYPIHFHLNGDMSTSYVKNCGIHKTFNRAVNIHGTYNTLIERTVIFDIMGGAFFLEDGIEMGNTLQYNLAVFVRESSSLLNDDVTPASYWVTNPNNTIQHNAAAGGTHFGFWYRMHNHPDGPSFTTDVCPKNTPLGIFQNNTAHSFGWFGLWIFEDYFPKKGGCGGNEVEPAVFRSLTAWNCEKGAEAVNSGALQFVDFVLVQNKLAGYEGKKVLSVPQYTDDSPMLKDSLVVGKTTIIPSGTQGCTKGGLVFPYGAGFKTINVRFVNFADSSCAAFRWTRISGTCSINCGGYTYYTEQLKFVNAPNKGKYAWEWEGMVQDLDGTITGKPGNWTIVATSPTLPSTCESLPEFSKGLPASMCPPQYKFHRFAFNNPLPASLEGKNFLMTNQYGTSSVPFMKKRLSHKPGWMCAVIGGETYQFQFENALQIKNISFNGQFDRFEDSDYLYVKIEVNEFPDRVSIDGGKNFINATSGTIDPSTAKNGDWEWDNANSMMKFIVHGRKRSRRGMSVASIDRPYGFTSFKCYFDNCIPPPDPNTIPPATARPAQFSYWTDTTMWNLTDDGYVTDIGGSYGLPQDYDNVRIEYGSWVVVNMTSLNKIGTLMLEGVLEFIDTPSAVYELNAEYIIIRGGRLIIGWPDDPFDGLASIVLRGNHSTPVFDAGDGPMVGAKAIGVFGGLDLFGKDVGVTWTFIATTATVGSNQIVLKDQVTWQAGDDIVIGPTSYNVWETESFKIVSVAADNVTLTLNETLKYKHIAHTETLSNGQVIDVAAGVGLLTRNIKIIGEDYDDLYTESFGARVIVGLVTHKAQTYGGYARLSNVEFYHTGQEGFTEDYDPRFSVAYVAAGTVDNVKPSSISKCSFHNGFSSAVGAFGIGGLNVTDNVVFGTVGNSIVTNSDDTALLRNMVVLMIATNSYQDRFETFNPRWEAGIEAMEAARLVMKDNLVTGSERIGYHVVPQECSDVSGNYDNNKAFSNLLGVVVHPLDKLDTMSCAKYANYTVWKSLNFGLYYQSDVAEFVSESNLLIENRNGLFTVVFRPSSVGHEYANKTVNVRSTTFVGYTSTFDCTDDVAPVGDDNIELSSTSKPSLVPGNGIAGLVFPNFYQASNKAPGKPWKGCMAYNAIGGLMTVSDVTFANYDSTCNGGYAITTNNGNDDGQHPVEIQGSTLINVPDANKVYYHRPNVGKINSADCVDMDCDALKKALLKDLDGTFIGHIGSVISQSEYEWDGDPRHGLGDYRIPKEMVTQLDGTRIPYNTIAPNKGIIRNDNCTYETAWNAYKCREDLNYQMLIIESMDPDTETRRLSPVAVLGDGYIDLINGPQDHGWCSGYTCRKRVSLFSAIVATGKEYLVHFTSVTPKHMRYRLLNTADTESIKLSVWYSRPNRLDVYVDDVYVIASNGRIDSQGRYIISRPIGNEFMPMVSNVTGTNYFDKDTGLIHFIMRGEHKIDVITKETIIVSFGVPAMTVTDFFGDNMIENIAGFLNIPLTKVRIVSVVSAATSGRRKRSASGVEVQIEIGDEPSNSTNATVTDPIDSTALLNLASDLLNECQVGDPSSSFNMSGSCESVSVPSTDPEVAAIVYSTPTPDSLYFHTDLVPEYEGVALRTQPKIRASDVSGVTLTSLGTAEHPWSLTASIRAGTGHPNAQLNGTVQINATDGWFNFTDLTISHMGTGYILDFNITFPALAENFTLASAPFNVDGRPLKVGLASITSGDITQNSRFSATLNLKDGNTDEVISTIDWRDHTWAAEVSMMTSQYATLSGVLTSTFDPASGEALFPDLNVTGVGSFYLTFRVVSTPNDFNITLSQLVEIVNPAHVSMVIEETYEMEVKFDVDFNKVLTSDDDKHQFTQNIIAQYANTWSDVKLTFNRIYEGSIVVVFTVAGSTTNVNSTAYSVCDSISNSTVYAYNGYNLVLSPYMTINNVSFYGVSCGEVIPADDEDPLLEVYMIAIIAGLAIIILLLLAALMYWKFCKKQKHTTGNMNVNVHQFHHHVITRKDEKAKEILFGEGDYIQNIKFSNKFNYGNNPQMATSPAATNWAIAQSQANDYMETMKDPFSRALKSHNQKILVQRVKVQQHTPPGTAESGSRLQTRTPPAYAGRQSPLPFGTPMIHRRVAPMEDPADAVTPVGRE